MAGYIFSLDSERSLQMYIDNGVYATRISIPKNGVWRQHQEGTWADYSTMRPGDNVYFFIKRKIYGIGELVNIGSDCKFKNFPQANRAQHFNYEQIQDFLLWDEGPEAVSQRWICTFKPSPLFFKSGIDMDDVLASNPSKFKMLRAFWKLSFIKIDDEENQALKDVILQRNEDYLSGSSDIVFPSNYTEKHIQMATKLSEGNYSFSPEYILSSCSDGSKLRHEMALEAGILYQLTVGDKHTVKTFGTWDYLSHQVVASPFKPIDYMDKMDVFGYSYIKGFDPTISKFLVAELKKDSANAQDVEQILKYVDWVNHEYAFGNYSMILGFLVAYDFSQEIVDYSRKVGRRYYTLGRRPAVSGQWTALSLIRYRYCLSEDRLKFETVNDQAY